MGRFVVSENVSLDGVVQDPTGEEGFERSGWFLETAPEDRQAWARLALEEALGATALLLGSRSEPWFAQLAHDLLDELRLTVFPVVLGAGTRLLGTGERRGLRLLEARTVGSALVRLAYARARS